MSKPIPATNVTVFVTSEDGKFGTPTPLSSLVSTDSNQSILIGTDGKLFVQASSGAPVTIDSVGPPTTPSIEGAIHLVTDDGTPTGTVLEQYLYDTESDTWVEMNRNAKSMLKFGISPPTNSGDWDGEEFLVTSDGTATGTVLEQHVWDKQSTTWVQRPSGGGAPSLETTSLTPVVYDGTDWVGAQADAVVTLAKAIQLSDSTIVSTGSVSWTSHGLDVGETYFTSQTTAGSYVTPEPTSGLSQKLFTVIDANTIAVQVQEGAETVDGLENENTISYQTSSDTKPNGPLKNDLLFVTSDGTRDGKMTEEWIYDGVAWVLIEGTTPVSGSVIDNTIADSAAVSTPGRYIVPTTGLANDFVGHANQYADWDGSTWTFTNATTNDAVLINSGPNAGQVWKFNGTTWSAATQTTGLAAYNWNLTSAYKATDLVIYNNNWYQANGNIPANTAFAIGTTGATWKQIGGATQSDYISVMRATSDQTAVGASTDLLFNSVTKTTGGILFNGAGVFTLKAGVTYKLEANVAFTNFSDATNGYMAFAWADATTGTLLTGVSRGVANPVNRNAGETSQTFAGGFYTPSTNQSIKLRTDTASGTASFRVSLSSASIIQIAPSAIVPSSVTVNDQTTSGFFDIGTMRIQTGRDPNGNIGLRTITLPAAFANADFKVTASPAYSPIADTTTRSVTVGAKTTTTFQAQVTGNNAGSGVAFDWIAIGTKP